MKINELRKKTELDLEELLTEKRKRKELLVSLLREKKVKNVKELREVKKDIARALTLMQASQSK